MGDLVLIKTKTTLNVILDDKSINEIGKKIIELSENCYKTEEFSMDYGETVDGEIKELEVSDTYVDEQDNVTYQYAIKLSDNKMKVVTSEEYLVREEDLED